MNEDIVKETQAWKALSAFLVKEPARMNEHIARLTAAGVIQALDKAGFEVVPKPSVGRPYLIERTTVDGVTTTRTAELVPGQETANEKAVRKQDEISARISEARRLGDWSRVTDADMMAVTSHIPGGRTYGNDHDLITRVFHDAGGGAFFGPTLVAREVTRLREKIITAWAGGRGSWDADAFARLQELAPQIASILNRFVTVEMQQEVEVISFTRAGHKIVTRMKMAGLR